jgi:hypothetical protein
VEELAAVARLLRRGGRIVLVTQNADSAAGRLFRGRHWAGYDFPRHPCLYGPSALRRLASKAGLVVERLDTARRPEVWARSAAYFLEDWGAPHWARRLASPRSPVARGVAVLIETGYSTFGGGAALETVLRPDDEGAR